MQQMKQVLRYDRPSWSTDGDGVHYAVTEDLSGYTLHGRSVPDAVDRMRGRSEERYHCRVSGERVERWVGALTDAADDGGRVGPPSDTLHRVETGDVAAVYEGVLPAAAGVVVADMERMLADGGQQ